MNKQQVFDATHRADIPADGVLLRANGASGPGTGYILMAVASAATASLAGYAVGCLLFVPGTGLYWNSGSVTSTTWTQLTN